MAPEGISWTGEELGPNDREINPTPWRKHWKPKSSGGGELPQKNIDHPDELPPVEYSDYN